jgi:hypothetical protein
VHSKRLKIPSGGAAKTNIATNRIKEMSKPYWFTSAQHLALPLTLIGVALFPSEEGHSVFILNILWAIHDLEDFVLGADGATGTNVPGNFFERARRRIPIAPNLNPNLAVGHCHISKRCVLCLRLNYTLLGGSLLWRQQTTARDRLDRAGCLFCASDVDALWMNLTDLGFGIERSRDSWIER